MTIAVNDRLANHAGDGSTTVFAFDFPIIANTELVVTLKSSAGVYTTQVLTTNYTVTIGSDGTGTITFLTAPASGDTIYISGDTPINQPADYVESDTFPAASHEGSMDRFAKTIQELDTKIGQGLLAPVGDTPSELPSATDRASKYLGFDSSGNPVALQLVNSDTDLTLGDGWAERLADPTSDSLTLNLKSYGAAGDYDTDDTTALKNALAAATGGILYVPPGVYRITESIDIPEGTSIIGEFAPKIATFPPDGGNKDLLRPGYKDQIDGSVFIFDGTANLTHTSIRSDKFSSVAFCMRYNHYEGITLRDFAIIQDMDVKDSGGTLTTGSTDNRSSSYEAGLILSSTLSTVERVTIFGYFDVQGLWIHDDDNTSTADPDYNKFLSCLISSGVAITNHDTAAGAATNSSNTGQLFHQCGIYAWDHHTRADGDFTVPAIYIDGFLTGSIGKIRGHSFVGCNVRCYANDAVIFGRADDIQFAGCVWEFPSLSGSTGADAAGGFVGTSDTGDVWVFGGAGTAQPKISTFVGQTGGQWAFAGGGEFDGFMVGRGSAGVRMYGLSDDSVIQLTDDFSSVTSGWTIRRDDSDSDTLVFQHDNVLKFSLDTDGAVGRLIFRVQSRTIASGEITISDESSTSLLTEGGASTDDLDTINGGVVEQILILRAGLSSNTVVVKDGTGNLRLEGDFSLDDGQDRIMLQYDGSTWNEISRSNNS